MSISPGLWLYLLLVARRMGPGTRPGAPALPDRPNGDVIWLHADPGTPLLSLGHLARQLAELRPNLSFLLTAAAPAPSVAGFPPGTVGLPLPADRLPDIRAFLDHFRVTIVVLTGLSLRPALIHETHARRIPLVLADVHLVPGGPVPWRWPRRMASALVDKVSLILARDRDSAAALARALRRSVEVAVTGRIEETAEPLTHYESERGAMAELLRARPVWLAAACPVAEEDAVIAAHVRAMRHAHRMLLILAPANIATGAALGDRLTAQGLTVAIRSRDEEPEEDVQIFLADAEGEMGLWYRLAPVTYMGGTLTETGTGRNPIEPAALGSAIVHGPHPGPYPEAYARLTEAFATRRVAEAGGLAAAVIDLIAADKAAFLAHNAWAASSGGAEVTERVVQLLFAQIDARPAASSDLVLVGT